MTREQVEFVMLEAVVYGTPVEITYTDGLNTIRKRRVIVRGANEDPDNADLEYRIRDVGANPGSWDTIHGAVISEALPS